MRPDRHALIDRFRTGTQAVTDALANITDAELDRPAPDGGWTARDVAHHLPDSETNGYIRLRRLIAEEDPLIVGYDQDEYARRLHYDRPIATSLAVLAAVRASSLELLGSMTPDEWSRTGRHSDSGSYSVDDWLSIYTRHPHDHAGQIRRARGWERQVAVPGGSLFVQQEGAGPAIVLLHAAIVDGRAWDALVPELTARGYRVIRYDRRGFGRSTTEDVAYSNRTDLAAVLDALDVDRAVLVGNSQGGQIAVDMAIEYPGRVSAVVSVAGGLGGFDVEATPTEQAMYDQLEQLEARGDAAGIAALDSSIWVNGPGQAADRVPAHIRDAVREMDLGIWDPPRITGRPIRLEPPAARRLASLTAPLLAIAGALDVSDVWPTAQHLAANAPNARAVMLPDVAHMIGMEAPAELARLVDEFLIASRVGADIT